MYIHEKTTLLEIYHRYSYVQRTTNRRDKVVSQPLAQELDTREFTDVQPRCQVSGHKGRRVNSRAPMRPD